MARWRRQHGGQRDKSTCWGTAFRVLLVFCILHIHVQITVLAVGHQALPARHLEGLRFHSPSSECLSVPPCSGPSGSGSSRRKEYR